MTNARFNTFAFNRFDRLPHYRRNLRYPPYDDLIRLQVRIVGGTQDLYHLNTARKKDAF